MQNCYSHYQTLIKYFLLEIFTEEAFSIIPPPQYELMNKVNKYEKLCALGDFFYSSSRAAFSTGDFPFFLSGPCLLRGSVWHLPSPTCFYTKRGVWKRTFPPFR